MAVLGVDQLQPGMVLAADLASPQGRRLARKGERLEEGHLHVCRIWGVREVEVEDPAPAPAGGNGDVEEQAARAAEDFFSLSDPDMEVVAELKRVCASRLAARWEAGRTAGDAARLDDVPEPRPLDDDLDAIVRRELTLASLPDVFYRIVEALKSPRCSASYMAEVIGQDPSLSAKLLRMVNSPFYGFPHRIDTLSRAVAILGANQLTNLALGVSVVTLFQDVPPRILDMRSFWRHCIGCGALARIFGRGAGAPEVERVFVAGLLHDVGRLVMLRNFPERTAGILARARAESRTARDVEREVWGFDHAELAGRLLKAWRLPSRLEENVGLHHDPGRAGEPLEPSILHAADVMAHALLLGASGTPKAPRLDPEAWRRLNVTPKSVDHVSRVVDGYVQDLEGAFFNDHD